MWSRRTKRGHAGQIATVKMYQRAGKIEDAEYRALLFKVTGYATSTDKRLSQDDFEHFMCALEALVDYRFKEGFCTIEDLAKGKIRKLDYWRRKFPNDGSQWPGQKRAWQALFRELSPFLPIESRNFQWLQGFACQACRQPIDNIWAMEEWQAAKLINALKDRILQHDPDHDFSMLRSGTA